MGLYTNPSFYNGYTSSDYTSVEPFKGEHFNYHELGIIAATESAANRNAFLRAIALNELASVEQYGTDQVFYESVNISGVFEKIKQFFKKLIEKVHKIFHTFVAKLSSWFQSSKDFAKKYEKEIIKKWGLVKSDWEFKGYKFTINTISFEKDVFDVDEYKSFEDEAINKLISSKSATDLPDALTTLAVVTSRDSDPNSGNVIHGKEMLKKARDKMETWQEQTRAVILEAANGKSVGKSLDSKEFNEEIFKMYRNGEDTKDDIKLSDLGSATEVISFIKEYDKVKSNAEKAEKAYTKSLDDLINAISKAQDELIKDNKEADKDKKLDNEMIIQASSFYQSCVGFVKECQATLFSGYLQALKDKCAQCKEVCVKVIGSSKKMTEESVDYSNYGGSNNFNSFIENVKLV